ncbi:MAG: hypothetical protein ACYTFA_06230 [Planctomycetota bacterium]|jgi:hypothetical protein
MTDRLPGGAALPGAPGCLPPGWIGSYCSLRGGSFGVSGGTPLPAALRYDVMPTAEGNSSGFRVAGFESCDRNGIPDDCDFDCGAPSGRCDLPGCGLAVAFGGVVCYHIQTVVM